MGQPERGHGGDGPGHDVLFSASAKTGRSASVARRVVVKATARAVMPPASPDPRPGTLAGQRPARALQPLRGARQRRVAPRLPLAGDKTLAQSAAAPQPATRRLNWKRMDRLADRWLPRPRILHPWPTHRFDARTQGRSPVRQTRTLGSARGPLATAVPTATLKRNAGPARCWTLGQLSRYWAVGSLLGVEAAVRFLANEAPGFRPVPTVRTPQGDASFVARRQRFIWTAT